MGSTIAEIHGQIWNELSAVGDYFDPDEAHRAVVQALNIRTAFTRNSSTNVLLARTAPFMASELEIDITAMIGFGVPLWIEERNPGNNVDFVQMRIINFSSLSDFRRAGIRAASFWSEEPNDTSSAITRFVTFTVKPETEVRIWFDRDLLSTVDAELTRLPLHIDDLLVKEAENILIDKIKLKMAVDLGRDEKSERYILAMIQAIDGLHRNNTEQIGKLERLWEIWAYRSRDTETSFNKPTPKSRWQYPEDSFYY